MPVTPRMNQLLAEISALGNSPGGKHGNLARQVLLGAGLDAPKSVAQAGEGSSGGPSVVSRIFDVLSRPNYAMASAYSVFTREIRNALKDGVDPTDFIAHWDNYPEILGAAWEGLEGQSKKTFQTVLQENGMEPGPLSAGLGFTLDIVADPTTYIGAGLVKGAGKAVAKAFGKEIGEEVAIKAAPKAIEEGAEAVGKTGPEPLPNLDLPGAIKQEPPGKLVWPPVGRAEGARLPGIPSGKPTVKYSPEAITDLARIEVRGSGKHARSFPTAAAEAKDAAAEYKRDFSTFMQAQKARKALKEGVPAGPRPKRSDYSSAQAFGKAVSDWKASAKPPMTMPAQVARAHDIVDRISRGDIPSTVRATPKPPSTPPASSMETAVGTSVAKSFISRVKSPDKYLNPTQQLRVFKNLLGRTVGNPVQRLEAATKMMREAEKYFKSQGFGMKHWDGMRLPLSGLIDELGGPTRISINDLNAWAKNRGMDEELLDSIENIRARSAMEDTPFLSLGLEQTSRQAQVAEMAMSPAKYANFQRVLRDEFGAGLRGADVSPATVTQGQRILDDILSPGGPQSALDTHSAAVRKYLSGVAPKAWQQTVNPAVTRQIENAVGTTAKQAGTQLGKGNKALEFLGLRFAAHYGMKDLRQTQLDFMLSAEANANRRHHVWSTLVRNSNADQRLDAFRIAQGQYPVGLHDEATEAIANQMKISMERLFSSSGIRDEADSVALRAGFVREDLNTELRRLGSENYFDNTGRFENGTDWLKSWEDWKLDVDPINEIAKLETAVERLSKKYGLFDEIAARWGSTRKGGDFQHTFKHHRLDGAYFPKDIVPQIQRMMDTMDNMYNPKSPMMKYLDEALSIWKTAVTIYSPAHHIRNGIGDAWLSWVAGVNNPKVYRTAAQVMKAQRGRYQTLPDLERLVGKNPQVRTKQRPLITTRGGKPLTADDIYLAAHQRGLLLSARQIEDIFGEPLLRGKIQPFGGRVHDFAGKISENREHFFRLAHFIDAVKKSKGKSLDDVFNEAAHQVRKWHPDGMDLTDFERNVMRRIFPFYSWTRKALPLVLEAIVMKPGKVLVYPKGMEALQVAMGIESPSRTDPFPTDQLFPDWIREKGIGPIAASGMEGIPGLIGGLARQGVDQKTGQPIGGYALVNPSNPMIDTIAQLGGMGDPQSLLSGVGESLNPGLRIPAELLTGHDVRTGAPVRETGQQFADYATNQVPLVSILSRLTNVGLGGPTARGEREGFGNLEALINQLTAAGLLGTGPYIKQAQFEQRDRLRSGY